LPGVFQYRHQLVFSWLLLMQIHCARAQHVETTGQIYATSYC
jgi:hypothetical protein